MKQMTLLLLMRDDEILLAMKKRGFGMGRWNGVGGKVEPGETLEQALVRECQEEINVTPLKYHQVADLVFNELHEGVRKKLNVCAYMCTEWEGEPAESEEMKPKWFNKSEVPYNSMWPDDNFWLPIVLSGKKVKGSFEFDEQDNIINHSMQEADQID